MSVSKLSLAILYMGLEKSLKAAQAGLSTGDNEGASERVEEALEYYYSILGCVDEEQSANAALPFDPIYQ